MDALLTKLGRLGIPNQIVNHSDSEFGWWLRSDSNSEVKIGFGFNNYVDFCKDYIYAREPSQITHAETDWSDWCMREYSAHAVRWLKWLSGRNREIKSKSTFQADSQDFEEHPGCRRRSNSEGRDTLTLLLSLISDKEGSSPLLNTALWKRRRRRWHEILKYRSGSQGVGGNRYRMDLFCNNKHALYHAIEMKN